MSERAKGTPPRRAASWARPAAGAGIAILVFGLVGLAGVQYLMPASFDNPAGVNQEGLRHFEQGLWGSRPGPASLSPLAFVWVFRLFLMACWAGYALAIVAGLRGRPPGARWILPMVVVTSCAYALFCPPCLSRDSYAYVAFARMGIVYGHNPYEHTLRSLYEQGDPAAAFYPASASSTYGPLWTLVSYAVLTPVRYAGLWWQVAAMKLLAAGANILAAIAGRAIARTLSPDRSDLTLLAIGMNPLFLIEGPGNGHNDLLMASLMLVGIALHARGRRLGGSLLVGSSIAIKFVTAAILPWILLEQLRDRPGRRRWAIAGLAAGLALAPTVAAFTPFWRGLETLAGISSVYAIQEKDAGAPEPVGGSATGGSPGDPAARAPAEGPSGRTPAEGPDGRTPAEGPAGSQSPEGAAGRTSREDLSGRTAEGPWRTSAEQVGPSLTRLVARQWPLVLIHLVLTAVLWRAQVRGGYLAAWVVFTVSLLFLTLPVWFAWYMIWAWSASLTRWNRLHLALSAGCFLISVYLTLLYTTPYPPLS